MSFVSVVLGQSELQQVEVFLFERLEATAREPVRHLKCICFVRPTRENVELLVRELKSPRYGSYSLVFSNVLSALQYFPSPPPLLPFNPSI